MAYKRDRDAALLAKQGAIQAARGQRKWFHEVDDVWSPLMGELSDRHPVLVFGGRSRVGKTTFCKCLSSPFGCLELNCKGLKAQPNLRLVTDQTELIHFDEASLQRCLDNKKILQVPEMLVAMGDSGIGMYAYGVALNGV